MDKYLLIIYIVIGISSIFIVRWIGAWMLRIDEIINNQKIIITGLKRAVDELIELNGKEVEDTTEKSVIDEIEEARKRFN